MNYFDKKLPYECISHFGDKLSPMDKLQFYCDIAKHFKCLDLYKLRMQFGIAFTQKNCIDGHFIGNVNKNEFEMMIDNALKHAHKFDKCEELPSLFGIEEKSLCECDVCPYSSRYKNYTMDEEIKLLNYAFGSSAGGGISPAAPYLEVIHSAGISFDSLITIKSNDSPDNGVLVPLLSILYSAASSWLGKEKEEWFIEHVLLVQLKYRNMQALYPFKNSTRLLIEGEIHKCVDFFKNKIVSGMSGEVNGNEEFENLVEKVKKAQHIGYEPVFSTDGFVVPRKRKSPGKKEKNELQSVPVQETKKEVDKNFDLSELFLGNDISDINHVPYTSINSDEEVKLEKGDIAVTYDKKEEEACKESDCNQLPEELKNYDSQNINDYTEPGNEEIFDYCSSTHSNDENSEDEGAEKKCDVSEGIESDCDNEASSINDDNEAQINEENSPQQEEKAGEIAEYIKRIESPEECVEINCFKNYFGEMLTVVDMENHASEEIIIFQELVSRKQIICDAVCMEGKEGLLVYFDGNEERKFKEHFFFIPEELIMPKLYSIMKSDNYIKMTLSPLSLIRLFSDKFLCQAVISIADIYVCKFKQAATLKGMVDGMGTGDHLLRLYKNMTNLMQTYYEGEGKEFHEEVKKLTQYHSALALSMDLSEYIKNASIVYSGTCVNYGFDFEQIELIKPGALFSIEDIELDMHCDVGIPQITREIICRLYSSRIMYDHKIKIVCETSDGFAVYVQHEHDAPTVLDVINRITLKTIRSLTGEKAVYAINIRGLKF